jgi:hypothetical protein
MRGGFNWRFLLFGTSATLLLCLLDAWLESDGLLYFFVVIPLVSLVFLVLLVAAVISKKNRRSLATLSMLVLFWLLSFIFVKNHFAIRNAARWSLRSRHYKAEVLRQPDPPTGELKHIDWDGWGFPGAGDTNVYLVFDPTDSLTPSVKNRQPGKLSGIPCSVPQMSRLERQWYAVTFYTDERWGKPHYDCGMND